MKESILFQCRSSAMPLEVSKEVQNEFLDFNHGDGIIKRNQSSQCLPIREMLGLRWRHEEAPAVSDDYHISSLPSRAALEARRLSDLGMVQ